MVPSDPLSFTKHYIRPEEKDPTMVKRVSAYVTCRLIMDIQINRKDHAEVSITIKLYKGSTHASICSHQHKLAQEHHLAPTSFTFISRGSLLNDSFMLGS